MTRRTALNAATALLSLVLTGCGTVPGMVAPTRVGQVQAGSQFEGLQVEIEPQSRRAVIGLPIRFEVTLRNIGSEPFWLPKDPPLRFHMVYANGRRDNYLEEPPQPHFYQPHQATRLKPGEALATHFDVKTYYFDHAGITEFYAIVDPPRNTNASLSPFWDSRAKSNVYGIYVEPRRALKRFTGTDPITPAG